MNMDTFDASVGHQGNRPYVQVDKAFRARIASKLGGKVPPDDILLKLAAVSRDERRRMLSELRRRLGRGGGP